MDITQMKTKKHLISIQNFSLAIDNFSETFSLNNEIKILLI